MRIAITGGSGLIGSHLARRLSAVGHSVVAIARSGPFAANVTDRAALCRAFAGCDAVAHCAGINRELGAQTYAAVHVEGTRCVVEACRVAGVRRVAMVSFLRARPGCGSLYHESKWAAEEIVRTSGLDYTVLKCGIVYGRGDHLLDHISHAIHTLPLFASMGRADTPVAPVAVEEVAEILVAALVEDRLCGKTVAVTGPERLPLREAVRRIAKASGRRVFVVPMPFWFHQALAGVTERTMKVPLLSKAQVRILAEGVVTPAPDAEALPADLAPRLPFDEEQIRCRLPAPGPFRYTDLRVPCRATVRQ